MANQLVQRLLQATFVYGTGPNGEAGVAPPLTVKNLRMSAKITVAGGLSMGELQLRVWGMRLSDMNQLSTLGKQIQLANRNQIFLAAGDTLRAPAQVYAGTIFSAWFDGKGAPDVTFNVIGHMGFIEQMKPVGAVSYSGSFNVASALQALAGQMGWAFENHGVTSVLPPGYYPGTARDQVLRIVEHAGLEASLDDNTLAIWPPGGSRGDTGITLTPTNGTMIEYPEFTQLGTIVRAVFNPAYRFGALVNVAGSQLTPANTTYKIATLRHDLDALLPHGQWATEMLLVPPTAIPGAVSPTPVV